MLIHTHFYWYVSGLQGLEPYWFYILNNFFITSFKFAHKNLDLGPLCLCERENKVLARAVLCKGSKFSNSDYKVVSGNAEKLLNCRSSPRISCSTSLVFRSGQQRKFFLSLYLCCNVLYEVPCSWLCWLELNPILSIPQTLGALG